MSYRIHSSRDLSPQDLIKAIDELDLNKLGLMELKTREPKESEPQPSHFYLEAIRRKLYDFYVVKKEVPTLKALLRALKKELKFKGSTKRLRKLLKKDGFQIPHLPREKSKKQDSAKEKQSRSKKHKKGKKNKKRDQNKKGDKKKEEKK